LVITSDPLGGSTAPVFQLRGQLPSQGSDDTVVTYVGDVPINARAFSGGLFDLQSVQILRGPQGTLFGKNSTGGAVIFTPRMADANAVSGFVEGTVGNYSYYQVGAGVNLPLVEGKLGLRVSGQLTRQDGFVRNLSGPDGADKKNEIVKVSLVATPTDELRNETFFSYFHARQHQNPLFTTADFPGLVAFVTGSPALADAYHAQVVAQQALGPRTIDYSAHPNNDDNDVYVVTNKTSYDLGFAKINNIFGYYNMKPRVSLSQTSTNIPIVDVSQNKDQSAVSDEIQLAGDTASLKWIIGGFFSREVTKTDQVAYLFGGLATSASYSDRYTSKAVFAQGTYDFSSVGLQGVKFTAGIRHTWDSRTGVLDVRNYIGGGPAFIDNPTVQNKRSYKNWSWTLGLDYQVTPDVLLYVASRHSYKAGGLNLVSAVAPAELQTFEPEKLTDVEIGAKATLHLGQSTVRTNIAAYRGWYKNMQFQELANCGQVASYVINAAKGSPKGLEFEFDAAITKNVRISGFYNRTLGKFDTFALVQPAGCQVIGAGVNMNGADFGNISKDTAGLNASYSLPLKGNGEELVLTGNWYMRGDRVGAATQGTNSAFPGYSLFNARLDYNNIGGSQFSAGVWVRNLTDKLYTAYRNSVLNLSAYDVRAYGDPRTFGLDVKYKF
ncbi:MAG TPA: TonB-dependent receptor, partial [Novosphingobium sp.]